MAQKNLSRRQFLRGAGVAGAGLVALLAGCQPKIVEVEVEKVVKETVVVTEQVEVKEAVLPWAYTPLGIPFDGKPISLSYWDWHLPRIEMMERWFAKYSETYPNVTFEISNVPFDDYFTKLKAAVPAKQAPDICYFHQGYGNFETIVWGGLLEPFPEEQFPPVAMRETFYLLDAWTGPEGRIYWIPTGAMSAGIYYNVELFEAEGLTGDDIPVTWDGLLDLAKSLTKYDAAGRVEISGYNVNQYEDANYGYLWRQKGTWLWDEQYTRPCFNQQEIIDALQWIRDLNHKHRVCDDDFLSWSDGFYAGKVYMTPGWSWFSGSLRVNQPQLKFGVRRIPTWTGEFSPCVGGGSADPQSIVVPVTGDPARKRVGLDVIAWLYSNPEFLIDNSLTLGSPPATPQIAGHPLLMKDETVAALTPQAEWLITGGGGAPLTGTVLQKWLWDGIYKAGMDIREAVLRAQEEVEQVTADYRKEVGEENFRVFERNYKYADLMRFPNCLS